MKDASTTVLKELGNVRNLAGEEAEQNVRFRLSTVAQGFVDLQQARHKADYDIGEPFRALDAGVDVAQARQVFLVWAEIEDELTQDYLYSLLFKDRS